MLWLMLLQRSSCCDYEFGTWDTKNDCFGKEIAGYQNTTEYLKWKFV